MTAKLFVESSLCMGTGVAGWGAVFSNHDNPVYQLGGPLSGDFQGAVTLSELAAVGAAVGASIGRGLLGKDGELQLCLRSTACLAVLRWVFPDSPFTGEIEVRPPKRLGSQVKDAQCLYDLHDLLDKRVHLSLAYTRARTESEIALEHARYEMDRQRPKRSAAR